MTDTRALTSRPKRLAFATAVVVAAAGLAAATTSQPAHADPGPGQTERIAFAPGTDNATVTGTASRTGLDRYVLRAAAGQTMTVELSSDAVGASIEVFTPDGTELGTEPSRTFEGQLPETGDYVIAVGGATVNFGYALGVRIPAGTTGVGSPRRVEFASGTDHGTIQGSIGDDQTDRYVLWAGAGQTMTLSPVAPLHAIVTAPDGTQLPGGPGESITYQLPITGDYTVEILPGMGEQTDYAITITIPA